MLRLPRARVAGDTGANRHFEATSTDFHKKRDTTRLAGDYRLSQQDR